MAQGFVVPQSDRIPAAPSSGGMTAVPLPAKPDDPIDAEYKRLRNRKLTNDLNSPGGGDTKPQPIAGRPGWFMDASGNAFQPKGLPKGNETSDKQEQNAEALLRAAGVDLAKGIDPIKPLIEGSTSGKLQAFGANAYGAITGDATDGMENIGKLQTIVSDMVLQLTGGGLGNQISNADRDFIMQRVGNLADPNVPADQRIAAWEQVKARMGNILGVKPGAQDKDNPNNAALYSRGDIGFNTPDGPDNPLTPEQQAAYDAWNKANPNATADQLRAFAQSINVTLGNADEIVAARDKGAGVAPGSTAIDRLTPQEQQEVDKKVSETGGFMRTAAGVADTATLGTSNKLIAALRDLAGKGEYDRELLKQNAITDQIADESPLAYRGGQFVGGLALPGFGARSVGQLARVGAGYGAAYGLGSSDRLADVPANVATNAAIGGGAGAAGGAVGNFLGRLGTNRAAGQGREVYDAAERLGMVDEAGNVQLMPADVGGPMTRRLTGAGAQGPVSAIPIVRRAQQVTEAAQGARDRIAQSVGNPAEVEAAGQAVSRGSEDFIRRTSARGGDLYRRAEAAAGDVRVPLPRAIEALDRNIAELGEVPGGAQGLDVLQGLRQQLEGEFSVRGIRGMRTALRDQFMENGLRGSDLQRRVEEVVSAASEDIAEGLAQQGNNNAAGLYRLADRYWRARLDTIDNVLQPIIGRQGEKSGEEVIAAVNRAAVGNNARLRGLLRALPAEDQSTVRATLISQLGRATDGQQNAAGDAFSLGSFLTQWNKLSPGAKRTLFGDDTRNALEDLARVADGSKQAQRYQNFSNSAGGVIGQVALSGGIGTLGGFMPLVAATISQYGAGRLLASPRFTRWLVGAARGGNPAQHVERLGTIAAREGAIAGEVTGLQQALLRAMNDNRATLPVAADSQADQRGQ